MKIGVEGQRAINDKAWEKNKILESKLSAANAQIDKLVEALLEAKQHFNSISSGLTTDINRVEHLTKSLAHAAHVEVRLALAQYEEFKKDSK